MRSRLVVVGGVVVLLVVVMVMVWDRPSPDPVPAAVSPPDGDSTEAFAGADSDAMVAPAEAELFRQVLSVYDAAMRDGVWYLLDPQGPQVHGLDLATGSVRTFGGRGEGPGEFQGLPSNIVVHGDSIVVTDFRSLHIFGPEGQHYADRVLRFNPFCSIEDALSLSGALVFLVRCNNMGEITWHALLEAHDGSLTELALLPQREEDVLGEQVVMGPHPNGLLFGRPYDDCMELFGHDGTPLGEECHEWIERLPLPEMTEDEKAELEAVREYGRQYGIEFELPDHMPPFLRISVTSAGELVYEANAPDGKVTRLLRRSATGQQTVVPVRSAPIMIAEGDHVLLGWQELDGTRLLFLEMPETGP